MKPQTLALITHLNSGGKVTRENAWENFRIQNITARLSELTALGYTIIKTPRKAFMDNRKITITTWSLRDPLNKGDMVRVRGDQGTLVSLKGRTGTVSYVDLKQAMASVHIPGVGYRFLKRNTLTRVTHHAPGTAATIKHVPLIVAAYHPEVDSYTLASADPKHTIVASAALVGTVYHATTQC